MDFYVYFLDIILFKLGIITYNITLLVCFLFNYIYNQITLKPWQICLVEIMEDLLCEPRFLVIRSWKGEGLLPWAMPQWKWVFFLWKAFNRTVWSDYSCISTLIRLAAQRFVLVLKTSIVIFLFSFIDWPYPLKKHGILD